jgi:adenine deaminase
LNDLGAVAPGYRADLLVLEDLESFRATHVLHHGVLVARDGEALAFDSPPIPEWVRQTVRTRPLRAGDLDLPARRDGRVRVIELVPGQILTTAGEASPTVRDGSIVADPARDLAKIAVVERHHATGRIGKGLVRGFNLRDGAFASTVAHDAHNLVVVGVVDDDMAVCVSRLIEIGGGIVVVRNGAVRAELPLPIAGLMSDAPVEEVVTRLDECQKELRSQGVDIDSPFMALSFLALSVIPSLKITDRGLVDVDRFEIVGLGVGD